MRSRLQHLPFLLVALTAIWFRLPFLGYSDYEPDEVKALFLPAPGQGLLDFLLHQRKGPVQFLVTYLARLFTPNYDNAFITRLPFALAGIAALLVFYKLVELHFGRKIALYASLLVSINGLIIGLSRVVQYQPFVLLFSTMALYFFSLAVYRPRWRLSGIYAGMLSWAGALFTHYDGVFIAPFAFYLLYRWYRQDSHLPATARLKTLALPVALCTVLLAAFYLPMLASQSGATFDYWQYRITGESKTLPPSSSIFTFNLYNPLLVLEVYAALGLLSVWKWKQAWPVIVWFLFPWTVLEGPIREPGTHIYAYVVPGALLVAFGLQTLEEAVAWLLGRVRLLRPMRTLLPLAGAAALFAGLFALSHTIFLDHPPEYPWEAKQFLFVKIGQVSRSPYKVWPYGFPYRRHWAEIRDYILSHEPNGYYSTNEDKSLTSFYIPLVNDIDKSGYYVHIYAPQDLREEIKKNKINYWMSKHKPVKVFKNEGMVVAEIYKMLPGTLEEIIQAGY